MTARVLVDADACPVKDEVYRVALHHDVPVTIVSNACLRIPAHPLLTRVVVGDGFDAADDWIADRTDPPFRARTFARLGERCHRPR